MRVCILSKRDENEYENRRLVEEFKLRGCDVFIVHPDSLYIHLSDKSLIGPDLGALPDIVLSRTGSGTSYHCFNLMRQYEAMGVRVINSSSAISIAMDKIETMQLAANAGIPIPKTLIHRDPDSGMIGDFIGFPCVVKLNSGSYGNGVGRCDNANDYNVLLGFIHALDRSQPILVQAYVADRVGTDLRVIVVGGKAVGAMLRASKSGDFRANISAGGIGEKFELTSNIISISESICKLVNLEIGGVDLLFKGDGFVLIETNSAPGFEGFERYCEANVANIIVDYCIDQSRMIL